MAAYGQLLVVRRPGDRAVDVCELAAARLVPRPNFRGDVLAHLSILALCAPARAPPRSAIVTRATLTLMPGSLGPFSPRAARALASETSFWKSPLSITTTA